MLSMANTNMEQSVSTKFFERQLVKPPGKQIKRKKVSVKNMTDIGMDDFFMTPLMPGKQKKEMSENIQILDTKKLDTSIVYANKQLKERKFQNLIVDGASRNNLPRKKSDVGMISEEVSIFDSNYRTGPQEKEEMQ